MTGWRSFTLYELGRIAEAIRSAQSLDQSEDERRSTPYPHLKSRYLVALAGATTGDLRGAREVAEELIAFGRASGNARSVAMGHAALALRWNASLDFERAQAVAQAGLVAAKDPLFKSMNAVFGSVAMLAQLHAAPALALCSEWLPYLERNESRWSALLMVSVRAGAELSRGQLSDGMRGLLAAVRDARASGMVASMGLVELLLLSTYVSVALMDVKPSVGALIRNPWFVLTQAPFAARSARALIERLRAEALAKDHHGILNMVDLCDARLRAHQGKAGQARECLDRIESRLREAGIDHVPAALQRVAAEIEASR